MVVFVFIVSIFYYMLNLEFRWVIRILSIFFLSRTMPHLIKCSYEFCFIFLVYAEMMFDPVLHRLILSYGFLLLWSTVTHFWTHVILRLLQFYLRYKMCSLVILFISDHKPKIHSFCLSPMNIEYEIESNERVVKLSLSFDGRRHNVLAFICLPRAMRALCIHVCLCVCVLCVYTMWMCWMCRITNIQCECRQRHFSCCFFLSLS